jgi:hypothetical protein
LISSNLSERTTTQARKIRVRCGFGFRSFGLFVLQGVASRYKHFQRVTGRCNSLHATRAQHRKSRFVRQSPALSGLLGERAASQWMMDIGIQMEGSMGKLAHKKSRSLRGVQRDRSGDRRRAGRRRGSGCRELRHQPGQHRFGSQADSHHRRMCFMSPQTAPWTA